MLTPVKMLPTHAIPLIHQAKPFQSHINPSNIPPNQLLVVVVAFVEEVMLIYPLVLFAVILIVGNMLVSPNEHDEFAYNPKINTKTASYKIKENRRLALAISIAFA
jgi:hypothetical protein